MCLNEGMFKGAKVVACCSQSREDSQPQVTHPRIAEVQNVPALPHPQGDGANETTEAAKTPKNSIGTAETHETVALAQQ